MIDCCILLFLNVIKPFQGPSEMINCCILLFLNVMKLFQGPSEMINYCNILFLNVIKPFQGTPFGQELLNSVCKSLRRRFAFTITINLGTYGRDL